MEWVIILILLTFFLGFFPCLFQVLLCTFAKSKWIKRIPLLFVTPIAVLSALDFCGLLSLPSPGLIINSTGIPVFDDWSIVFLITIPLLIGIGLGWLVGSVINKE